MITWPHHDEFLSADWRDEARRVTERELKKRPGALPFSLSERFRDAPPHLACPGDVAAWTLRWDGNTVATTDTFDPDADVTSEGNYQAALMLAQTVGAGVPELMATAFREMRHLHGNEAVVVRGDPPDEHAKHVMAQMQDHMARRTVENPDIAHRARQQGLLRHLRELDEQGYTVIERAISPAFADELREATLRTVRQHDGFQLQWMLYHGLEFERIVQNPLLMTAMDATLGRGAGIASISAICKGPGPGVIPLHTDYSLVPEPYPEFAMTGVGVWALEDWTVASGPTWLVPGSHRQRRGPRPDEKVDGVPIEMPKGSVVYFTHGVWHWQGDRTEPGERVTLHSHFNRGILRGLEPKRVDPQMMHRNPPRLGEMLGEDDWFDKLSASGRDHLRARYMARLHAFTNERLATLTPGTSSPVMTALGSQPS